MNFRLFALKIMFPLISKQKRDGELLRLKAARISIFAISTYDTDYILVKEEDIKKAADVLRVFCTIKSE